MCTSLWMVWYSPPSTRMPVSRDRSPEKVLHTSSLAHSCRMGRWRMPTFCRASSSAALLPRHIASHCSMPKLSMHGVVPRNAQSMRAVTWDETGIERRGWQKKRRANGCTEMTEVKMTCGELIAGARLGTARQV